MIRYYLGTVAIAFTILFTLTTGCNEDEPLQTNTEIETGDTTWVDSTTVFGQADTMTEDTVVVIDTIFGCTDPNADNFNQEATDDDGSCTYTVLPTGSIDDLVDDLQADQLIQLFYMNSEWGATLITNSQALFTFDPNSFETGDGNPVTGQVEIRIIELYTKGDILRYGRPTISNNGILRSDGEFHVEVLQDGQQLQLKSGYSYKINIPNNNPDSEMRFFEGVAQDEDFLWIELGGPNGELNWVGINEWAVGDSIEQWYDFGYEIFSDRFGWLNCDAFYDYPPEELTEISVTLPENYTNQNTLVYLVFNDENTILPLWGNSEDMAFASGLVPLGVEATIVVLASVGEGEMEEYEMDLIPITIEADQVIPADPEEATFDEIENALNQL